VRVIVNPGHRISLLSKRLLRRLHLIVPRFRPLCFAAIASVVFVGMLLVEADDRETFIWRVSDEDSRIYLLGSIHVLRPSDYPLAGIYDIALEQVDSVTFEIILDGNGLHY